MDSIGENDHKGLILRIADDRGARVAGMGKSLFGGAGAFCRRITRTHTGYTGTSIVCDPESETFVIILANRVHPKDDGSAKSVRINVADIVFSSLSTSPAQNGR